jgi:lipoprotein-releasing system ATP-binding protein
MSNSIALELRDIHRSFQQGGGHLNILRGVSLSLLVGEVTGLVGPSGSGKSTLLQIAGLLEKPDRGAVVINGQDCSAIDDHARTKLRQDEFGFVYQFHNLLPEFTASENVILPQLIAGVSKFEARDRARKLLSDVGLTERVNHFPTELSGGEQQRVAIARALANSPSVLLADEPTGNLDEATAATIFKVILKVVKDLKVSAFIVTHNNSLSRQMDRVVALKDGVLIDG